MQIKQLFCIIINDVQHVDITFKLYQRQVMIITEIKIKGACYYGEGIVVTNVSLLAAGSV